MTTNIAGRSGREYHTCQTHYLRAEFDYTAPDNILVGELPKGALIKYAFVYVVEGFDGTNPRIGMFLNSAALPVTTDLSQQQTLCELISRPDTSVAYISGEQFPNLVSIYFDPGTPPSTTGRAIAVVEYYADLR